MLKRALIAALVVPLLVAFAAAPVEASVRGAKKAVKREVKWDYGPDMWVGELRCKTKGAARYSCRFKVQDLSRDCILNGYEIGAPCNIQRGRARVEQSGRRYSVDYRIYW